MYLFANENLYIYTSISVAISNLYLSIYIPMYLYIYVSVNLRIKFSLQNQLKMAETAHLYDWDINIDFIFHRRKYPNISNNADNFSMFLLIVGVTVFSLY